MRPIHPFPARMAPDTVFQLLKKLPSDARVLDPMCGSGVVIRQSLLLGHDAKGLDVDPLAVLMTKVWTRRGTHKAVRTAVRSICEIAAHAKPKDVRLPWIDGCQETQAFVDYWFAAAQQRDLRAIAWILNQNFLGLPAWVRDCLRLALSRIIITKHAGASLAWDVSHSRPHKVRTENAFDVPASLIRSADRLADLLDAEPLPLSGKVSRGDCRRLANVAAQSIDAVVTSPPYLNAIDYLRGHKLSLVWMGYSIPELRDLRARAVGTERVGGQKFHNPEGRVAIEDTVTAITRLPNRQKNIVCNYAADARLMLLEMHRVLKSSGRLVLVLGDSNLRGVFIENSKIFRAMAKEAGFRLVHERKRPLLANRRYLPIESKSAALASRMRYEVIQSYRLAS